MEDHIQELGAIENLAPTDAILARTLIRNGLINAAHVVEAARAAAGESDEGVLELLISSGRLHPGRAREIEQALEKKLAERSVIAEEPPVPRDPSMRWPTPFAKGPRMWRPRDRDGRDHSTVLLLEALRRRKERAALRRAAIDAAGRLEEKLARSEAEREELKTRLVAADGMREQLVHCEAIVDELRRELATVAGDNEALRTECEKLNAKLARSKKRKRAVRTKPAKLPKARKKRRAA